MAHSIPITSSLTPEGLGLPLEHKAVRYHGFPTTTIWAGTQVCIGVLAFISPTLCYQTRAVSTAWNLQMDGLAERINRTIE